MMDPIGLSFAPGAEPSGPGGPSGGPAGPGPLNALQEAIRLLSLRIPQMTTGAGGVAPPPLLAAMGGDAFGGPPGTLDAFLRRLLIGMLGTAPRHGSFAGALPPWAQGTMGGPSLGPSPTAMAGGLPPPRVTPGVAPTPTPPPMLAPPFSAPAAPAPQVPFRVPSGPLTFRRF